MSMTRTDPVYHRAHAATWYAWGRIDQAIEDALPTGFPVDPWVNRVDVFEFADFAAGEARDYHDPAHERSHLGSVQSQWADFLKDRQIT